MGYVHHLAEPILPISTLPRMLFMDVLKYRIKNKKIKKKSDTGVSRSAQPLLLFLNYLAPAGDMKIFKSSTTYAFL